MISTIYDGRFATPAYTATHPNGTESPGRYFTWNAQRGGWELKRSYVESGEYPNIVLTNFTPSMLASFEASLGEPDTGPGSWRAWLRLNGGPDVLRTSNGQQMTLDNGLVEPTANYGRIIQFDARNILTTGGAYTITNTSFTYDPVVQDDIFGFQFRIHNRNAFWRPTQTFNDLQRGLNFPYTPDALIIFNGLVSVSSGTNMSGYLIGTPTPQTVDGRIYYPAESLNDQFFRDKYGVRDRSSYYTFTRIHEGPGHVGIAESPSPGGFATGGHAGFLTELIDQAHANPTFNMTRAQLLAGQGITTTAFLWDAVELHTFFMSVKAGVFNVDPAATETTAAHNIRIAQLNNNSWIPEAVRNAIPPELLENIDPVVLRTFLSARRAAGQSILKDLLNAHPEIVDLRDLASKPLGEEPGLNPRLPIIAVNTNVSAFENLIHNFGEGVGTGLQVIDLAQIGLAFGSVLGNRLSDNPFEKIVLSATLSTAFGAVGEFIDVELFHGTRSTNILTKFTDAEGHSHGGLGETLLNNLQGAAIGALSSYLTAELLDALGIDGLPGEVANSVGGAVISRILNNIASGDAITSGIGAPLFINAIGSFIGSKLAYEIKTFNNIGGQIGSAVGSIVGGFASTVALAALNGVALGAGLGVVTQAAAAFAVANPVLAVAIIAAVVLIDTLLGGLIGSIFGGTPRSGADALWDADQREFVVANVYARKGGSKETAKSLAGAAAQNFNAVLAMTGSTLLDPETVQSGTYGMRMTDYVYRPVHTRDKHAITARFTGEDAAVEIVNHGTYLGLSSMIGQLAGGNLYVKRAIAASLRNAGGNPGSDAAGAAGLFSAETLYGDIQIAGDYQKYLAQSPAIDAMIGREPESAFSAGWVITITRAIELGINRRAESDWIGGYNVFLDEAIDGYIGGETISAGRLKFGMGDAGVRGWEVTDPDGNEIGAINDTIQVEDVTYLRGTAGADDIRLSADHILSVPLIEGDAFGLDAGGSINNRADTEVTAGADGYYRIHKTGSSSGFDASAVAAQAMTGDFVLHTQSGTENSSAFIAMTGDVPVDGSYAEFDYAVRIDGNEVSIYENGAVVASFQVKGDVWIWREGGTLKYGAGFDLTEAKTTGLLRTVTAGSTPLYFASSLATPDMAIDVRLTSLAATPPPVLLNVAATIDAGLGDDIVQASDRGDNVLGGDGNDTLYGGRLDDWLLGGDGNDIVDAGSATAGTPGGDGNYLDGGAGNDIVRGREGSDWLEGGAGIDQVDGGGGDDVLSGGADDGDTLHGGQGDDIYLFRAGDGADTAEDEASAATGGGGGGSGNPLRDRLTGLANGTIVRTLADWVGEGAWSADGGASADSSITTVTGPVYGGEDKLTLGIGITLDDIILIRGGDLPGTTANDLVLELLTTNEQNERVPSGDRLLMKDWFDSYKKIEWLELADGQAIRIADFQTFIVGTSGNDSIIGTAGRDFVVAGDGDDWLSLLAGDDVGVGGRGKDWVSGDEDDDLLVGGDDDDHVLGGSGNDVVSGDAGVDEVDGGAGNDVLAGGRGDGDIMSGGEGDDTFRFSRGDGRDAVIDSFAGSWEDVVTLDTENLDGEGLPTVNYLNGAIWDAGLLVVGNDVIFDGQNWQAGVQYDQATHTVRRFVAGTPGHYSADATVAGQLGDSIEFGIGINLQDVEFAQSGYDLVVGISQENAENVSFDSLRDQVWVKDWFANNDRPIEHFVFAATGSIDTQATKLGGGTDGEDSLAGSGEADWLTGNGGDDTITGNAGNDILNGNSGSDNLAGGDGDDILFGGAGNDILDGGAGRDMMIGGDGEDTVSYAGTSSPVAVYLNFSGANFGVAKGDQYASIENITGTDGNDYALAGDDGENVITGGAGNDRLYGGGGSDTYVWNAFDYGDTIDDRVYEIEELMTPGGTFELPAGYAISWEMTDFTIDDVHYRWELKVYDTSDPTNSDKYLYYKKFFPNNPNQPDPATWPADGWRQGYTRFLNGIPGGAANDYSVQILRQVFTDSINAGEDDTLELGRGISLTDLTFEHDGSDLIVRYQGLATNFIRIRNQDNVNSRIEWLQLNDGLAISLANPQSVISDAALVGDGVANFLIGRNIAGAVDTIDGDAGDDVISSLAGNDILSGGAGDDVIEGGAGADHIDGGANSAMGSSVSAGDTVRYVNSAAVTIDLRNSTTGQSGGEAAGDILVDIENVVGSLDYDDHITGTDGGNRLLGLGGNDTLTGLGGDDVLLGDEGDDILLGGAGDDNVDGGAGNDTLAGDDGDDLLVGGDGIDALTGGAGKDRLLGGAGNDTLDAGAGDDNLSGDVGNDTLLGGDGNDIISGGAGNDQLQGGAGDDSYLFGIGGGQDQLIDAAGKNQIMLDESVDYRRLWLTRNGDDLVVGIIGTQDKLTVTGFFAAQSPSTIFAIVTNTHMLYLSHAAALITQMTALQTSAPDTLPTAIGDVLGTFWHEGAAAVPEGAPIALTLDEDVASPSTSLGVTDPDDNIVGYQVGTAATHGTVSIDAQTGAFIFTPDANYHGADAFSIVVTDADGQSAEIPITVTINAVNDAPSQLGVAGGGSLSISEAISSGAVVGQLVASDVEGDALTFTLVNDAGGRFVIANDGSLRVQDGVSFDHESAATLTVRVRVSDGNGGSSEQDFGIAVTDVNEGPAIAAGQGFTVAENVAIGTQVGTLVATDPDSAAVAFGQLRYYFLNGTTASGTSADGRYAIDALTGAITTVAALDHEAATPSADYVMLVRDNAGAAGYNQVQATVTIGIANLNEANSLPASYGFSVNENVAIGTQVGTVAASDLDAAGDAYGRQRYYFWDGHNAASVSADGRYAINAATGAITVAASLDHEVGTPSADYVVIARDNEGNSGYHQVQTTVTIGIADVNEAPELGASRSFNVDENVAVGTQVGTVTAVDPDSPAVPFGQLRYYFLNGTEAGTLSSDGRYTIDALTGAITTAASLNFEAGTPSADYVVLVRDKAGASGGLEDQVTVTIGINNLNEAPVVAATIAMSVDENVATGTTVGTVAATDPDVGTSFGQLRYYFLDGSNVSTVSADGRYAIDTVSGAVSTNGPIDREAGPPSSTYTVAVRDNQGTGAYNQVTTALTIGVNDLNEAPTMASSFAFAVDENVAAGTVIGTVSATDPDAAGTAFATLRYYFWNGTQALATSADGRYAINAITGAITSTGIPDFESGNPTADYLVIARDNPGASPRNQVQTVVTIAINDLNEAPSLPASLGWNVNENVPVGSVVGTVAGSDPDGTGPFGQLRYFFLNGGSASAVSADGRYTIDAVTGVVSTNAALDYEAGGTTASYTVVARDNQGTGSYNQASTTLTVGINNLNEANSLPATYAFSIDENVAVGTQVGTVAATDPDETGSAYGSQAYYFLNGGSLSATSADGRYQIDIATGVITSAALLDYETGTPSVTYTVVARDNAGGISANQAQTAVTIGIANRNESPTGLSWSPSITSLAERDHLAAGAGRPAILVGAVAVLDPDLAGTPFGTYDFAVLADERFEIVGDCLYLKADAIIDFEAGSTITLTVRATDRSNAPFTIDRTIAIQIDNLDDIFDGTAGADTLTGQQNRDVMTGLGGGDVMSGLAGNDQLDGGAGDDRLLGGDGDDTLLGGDGLDTLVGGTGNDTLYSGVNTGQERDVLYGGAGNDQLHGEGAFSDLIGGAGADQFIGGAGVDRVSYAWLDENVAATQGVTADLESPGLNTGVAAGDTYSSIEDLAGTGFSDTLRGTSGANTLSGGGGGDVLEGRGGDDLLQGGDGLDNVFGGDGSDVVDGGDGNDFVFGGTGNGGPDGNDRLLGGAGDDQLFGEAGDDILDGGIGNDVMRGGEGNDTYVVARHSGNDQIWNFDVQGTDILGFIDAQETINAHDLWFTQSGDDLLIKVLGEDTSVRVIDWFGSSLTEAQRDAFRIDFIGAGDGTVRQVNVQALVDLMAGRTQPTTVAAHDQLLATDAAYRAEWQVFWKENDRPTLTGVTDQVVNEDDTISFTITVGDDTTPLAGIQVDWPSIDNPDLISDIQLGAPDENGHRVLTITPAANASGTAHITLRAIDANGAATSYSFAVEVVPVVDKPAIEGFSSWSGNAGVEIPLTLSVNFPDADGSETQEIKIEGLPPTLSLNHGSHNTWTNTWTLTAEDLEDLKIVDVPSTWSADFNLVVTATASENGQSKSSTATATIAINGAPTGLSFSGSVTENASNGAAVGSVWGVDPDGDALTFSLLDNAGGRFALSTAGAVTVANGALLNYEAATSHTITVRATDPSGLYRDQSFTISVGNANEANSLPATYAFAVNENVAAGTTVGTVAASDLDSGGAYAQQRYYFLNSGVASATSADGRYAIDATTGVITTASGLNYEAGNPSVAYTVIARDNAGAAGYNQTASTVTIGINDLNEAPSIQGSFGFSVNENVALGTTVGTVAATDPDGGATAYGTLRYYFWDGSNTSTLSADGRYAINQATGAITTAAGLNFEAGTTSVTYQVIARDNAGAAGYNQVQSAVTIAINNLNEANSIPSTYGFSVNENVAVGTTVGTVAATDLDSSGVAFGQQAYYFWNGTTATSTSSDGRYAINQTTGVITTAAGLNFEAGTTSVTYQVIARDNAGGAGYNQVQSAVTIGINNLNEANSIPSTYGFSVNENVAVGTTVGTVAATDLDSSGVAFGQQAYYFWNGTTATSTSSDGRYAINQTTGVITTAAGLNFEAGTTSVTYQVIARDNAGGAGYNQVQSAVTIGINNLNEANSIPSTYGFSVNENVAVGTTVGTVAATDLDSSGVAFGQQAYYFWNGTTATSTSSDGRYAINQTTGVITTAAGLNFEAGTTSVTYQVIARDNAGGAGYNQVQSAVTIGINNLNEANSIPSTYGFSVNENVAVGTTVGTVAATDLDSSGVAFGQQAYYFWNGTTATSTSSDGRYAINQTTGVITTAAGLNFEAGTTSVTYQVIARDNAGAAGYNQVQSAVTIGINNLNEANSIPSTYGFSVNENVASGTLVGTVAATDLDSSGVAFGQQVYYFLNSGVASATSADGRYTINTTSGAITTNAALNYEAGNTIVTYQVIARDNGGGAGYNQVQSSVTIGINDLNEANSIPSTYGFSINENVAVGTTIGTVAATDLDGSGVAFGQQRYYFWNGSAATSTSSDGRYAINATTGVITSASALSYEGGSPSVVYQVIARDNAGAAGYNQVQSAVTIGINDLNEANSVPSTYGFSVNENVVVGTGVGTVAATDLDGSGVAFGQQRYYFWNGTTATAASSDGRYTIDATTGVITTAAALNYEAGNTSVTYQVIARDNAGGAGYNQVQSAVTIGIANVNETPTLANQSYSVAEQPANLTTPLITLNWGDPDGTPANGHVFTIVSGNAAGYWSIDNSGRLFAANALNYEDAANRNFTLHVRVTDQSGSGLSTEADITVSVTNVNEAPNAVGAGNQYPHSVNANVTVGTVTANDPDGDTVTYQIISVTNANGGSGTMSTYRVVNNGGTASIVTNTAAGAGTFKNKDIVTVRVTDGTGAWSDASVTIVYGTQVPLSPIVLDLDGDGVELVARPNSNVYFDMDGDGVLDRTGWVAADDALLALDRNHDGIVTNGREISFIDDVQGAVSDVEGLRAFDTNDNGLIDAGDEAYSSFMVWQDLNQDGVSQASELRSLADAGIRAINLAIDLTGEHPTETSENLIYGTGSYFRTDGTTGQLGDVMLAFDPANVQIAPPIVFDLDGDGVTLTALTGDAVRFDMDGDGIADPTGWAGPADGILALDRNGDGVINDISEISFVKDLAGARTDLEGLRAFDSNKDGLLSSADTRFRDFRVWVDANHNGISESAELKRLAELGIVSIKLDADTTGAPSVAGENVVFSTTTYLTGDGETRSIGDVGFAFISSRTGEVQNAPDNPVVPEDYSFERSSRRYWIQTKGGQIFIQPRSPKGMLDPGAGGVANSASLLFRDGEMGFGSAIVFDLDGDGLELKRRKKSDAGFDMNADGIADDTGWVGRDEGILVLDRNGNGKVDGIAEMSFISDLAKASSSLQGLSAFDDNHDGLFDAKDKKFADFRIWQDRNGDGISDEGELTTLEEAGIASIGLGGRSNDRNWKKGQNIIVNTGIFTRTNGATGTIGDVALAYKPSSTMSSSRETAAEAALRDLRAGLDERGVRTWAHLLDQDFDSVEQPMPDPGSSEAGKPLHAGGLPPPNPDQGSGDAGILGKLAPPGELPVPILDFDGSVPGGTNVTELVPRARLAYLVQQMAGFGGRVGEHGGRDAPQSLPPFDYFAR